MLLLMIKEYIAICDYLLRMDELRNRGYIVISKNELVHLLKKNNYESPDNKLRYWKKLGWIRTESGRLTCRVQGKRMIKIVFKVYETMKKLNRLTDK